MIRGVGSSLGVLPLLHSWSVGEATCAHRPPGSRVLYYTQGAEGGKAPCRSLGQMAFNGIVVHLAEFVGAESLGQRYFFLADLLEEGWENDTVNTTIVSNLALANLRLRRLAYPQVKYVTDRFHSKGHADHWCKQHCMHSSPENGKALQGVNTSVCEQQFSKLGRYKFMVSKMGAAIGSLSLHEVVEPRNEERARHASDAVGEVGNAPRTEGVAREISQHAPQAPRGIQALPLRGVSVGLSRLVLLARSGAQAIRRSWLHLSA